MINKAFLMGDVGKDPESKTIRSGAETTRFTIATTKQWKGNDGKTTSKTVWHNIVSWGTIAKTAMELSKGDLVLIEGEIDSRTYEKDGQKKYITEIVANKITLISSWKSNKESSKEELESEEESIDGLPF
jgi:single-strand DNA-binding protein